MDTQLIVELAPKEKIVLHYVKDFCDAFQAIVDDKENHLTVINMCWAVDEKYLTRKDKATLHEQVSLLNESSITVLAPFGDGGMYRSRNEKGADPLKLKSQ